MGEIIMGRRALIGSIAAMPLLSGCDALNSNPEFRKILSMGETMHQHSQRALMAGATLAPEFTRADLSPTFRANGSRMGDGPTYAAHVATGFRDWRVRIGGLVNRPLALSMADIRGLPHPDYPPRLRRRLERDWRMAGRAAGPDPGGGAAQGQRQISGVPLRRQNRRGTLL